MTVAALALDNITCTFAARDNRAQRYTAVKDTTLRIAPGEFVSVVGPTGCGKSTLLNVGAGLLGPSSGTVSVFGEPLKGINRRAGYMFQADALMPWRSAIDNVMAGLAFHGVPPAEARVKADEWLKRVGLGGFGDRYPHQLSGGMRKRVAMAQTLILDPDIILMDEPFSALAMSDRVVVLSAGPGTHPIGEFTIDLPRPRDVAEIRSHPRFVELHAQIWSVLRDEVLKGYQQQLTAV
jgi:NitT/TauT family transport system ATP-binding protein